MLSFQNANVPGESRPSPGPWESWTVSWLQRGNHLPSCRLDDAFLLDKADELPQAVTPTARWPVWPVVPERPLTGGRSPRAAWMGRAPLLAAEHDRCPLPLPSLSGRPRPVPRPGMTLPQDHRSVSLCREDLRAREEIVFLGVFRPQAEH